MEHIEKAVFLDFDGVLFDTVKEAYCVAMLASGKVKSAGDIDFRSEHYKEFKKCRFLIAYASDCYRNYLKMRVAYMLVWCERQRKIRASTPAEVALKE